MYSSDVIVNTKHGKGDCGSIASKSYFLPGSFKSWTFYKKYSCLEIKCLLTGIRERWNDQSWSVSTETEWKEGKDKNKATFKVTFFKMLSLKYIYLSCEKLDAEENC